MYEVFFHGVVVVVVIVAIVVIIITLNMQGIADLNRPLLQPKDLSL